MSQFCPDCGKENPGEPKFCLECGKSLSINATKKLELLDNRYEIEEVVKSGILLIPC